MIGQFASFARHQFELSAKQADGATLREHLEAAAERSGRQPAMLADGPTLPKGAERTWSDFLELHHARQHSDMGEPRRISFRDMLDWQGFYGVTLTGWQVQAIKRADDEYLASRAKVGKR